LYLSPLLAVCVLLADGLVHPWVLRQYDLPKRQWIWSGLYVVTSQKEKITKYLCGVVCCLPFSLGLLNDALYSCDYWNMKVNDLPINK
jgi:hypothetical protein